MTQSEASHALLIAAVVVLVGWRLYSRIRRAIGRQQLAPKRSWFTIVIFPVLIVMLAFAARLQPVSEGLLACGLAVGIRLGLLGLRLTRFEVTDRGLYYTPSAHVGVALSTLLGCRIAYRFIVGGYPGSSAVPQTSAHLTPLTLLLIGMLVGYYTTYALGLLRWASRARKLPPAGASSRTPSVTASST